MPIIWNVGLGQQTAAVQAAYRQVMGRVSRSGSRKRRKKKAAAPRRRAAKRKSKSKGNRFKKGSAAAKAWMKKIRKKRAK